MGQVGKEMERLKQLAKTCRKRGGNCPCVGYCAAINACDAALDELYKTHDDIDGKIKDVRQIEKRLRSPMVNWRQGFMPDPRYEPVVVFEGDDQATFGYEDKDGEWIESNEWPFDQPYIWWDDCERLGIRVE